MLFENAHNIRFWGEGCSKTISWEGSYAKIFIKIDFHTLPHFLRKWSDLRHWKTCKQLKNALLKSKNIRFWAQGCSKTIFWEGSDAQILIKIDFNTLPDFLRKWFHLGHSKTSKKMKNDLLKRSQHSVFSSRLLQNRFVIIFFGPNFVIEDLET